MSRRANLAALCCASVLTIATLKDNSDGYTGRTEWDDEFRAERRHVEVDIAAVENRLEIVGHDGPIYLGVGVDHIDKEQVDIVRWSVQMTDVDGTPVTLSGDFEFGGEVHTEDDGRRMGDLRAEVGQLCDADDDAADCLPCDIAEGCSLSLDVDRCHGDGGEITRVVVLISDADGHSFEHHCGENDEGWPCDQLDDWVVIAGSKGEPGLCE
jgi:hypothetical protein